MYMQVGFPQQWHMGSASSIGRALRFLNRVAAPYSTPRLRFGWGELNCSFREIYQVMDVATHGTMCID